MAYQLDGSMVEICSCHAICPCWLGEDPTHGQDPARGARHGRLEIHHPRIGRRKLVGPVAPSRTPARVLGVPAELLGRTRVDRL